MNAFMQQDGRYGGIHTAAESKDNFFVPDCLTDIFNSFSSKRFHRPGAFAATDSKQKVLQHLFAHRGMGHFGVELNAGQAPVAMGGRRHRRVFCKG